MTELLKHSFAGNYLADSCQPIAVSDISDLQNKPICGLTIISRAPPQVSSRSAKCRAQSQGLRRARISVRALGRAVHPPSPRPTAASRCILRRHRPLLHAEVHSAMQACCRSSCPLFSFADVRIIHLDPAKMESAARDDISHEVR